MIASLIDVYRVTPCRLSALKPSCSLPEEWQILHPKSIFRKCREIYQKCGTLWHARLSPLLGGDLNPVSGFCFPLVSRVFPWGISIRVETGGSWRKQKCGILWRLYIQIFYMYWAFSTFPRGYGKSKYDAVLSQGIIYLRVRGLGPAKHWPRTLTDQFPPDVGCWPLDAGLWL